jgi:UDP-N-acetylmuramate dehydrogenase
MVIRSDVPLGPLTTLQVGGPARFFSEARSTDDVREALEFARSRSLPLFVLGGGSNLVVSDAGFPGLVLKVAVTGVRETLNGKRLTLEAGAGEEWDKLVELAVSRNCAGIECLSGIPGSVGGTPVQNVGAYGQEVSQTIESVTALDRETGQELKLNNSECGFRYRTSIFNSVQRNRYIILRVRYALHLGGGPQLAYRDLKTYFSDWKQSPTLAETRLAIKEIRARKAMLLSPGDEDSRSAGSFFKNPVLTNEEYLRLVERAKAQSLEVPSYPAEDDQHSRKVSAAWLVEHSGFAKGYSEGHVGISRKHALAIVNRGQATAAEIVALKDRIQRAVAGHWDLHLEPEPVFIGF